MKLARDERLEKKAIGLCFWKESSRSDVPIYLRVLQEFRHPDDLFTTWGSSLLWEAISKADPVTTRGVRDLANRFRLKKRYLDPETGRALDLDEAWDPDLLYNNVTWDEIESWRSVFRRLDELRVARAAQKTIGEELPHLEVGDNVRDSLVRVSERVQGLLVDNDYLGGMSMSDFDDTIPETPQQIYVPSGWPSDAHLRGWRLDGELDVVSGVAKTGKSRLVVASFLNGLGYGVRYCYLTLESGMLSVHTRYRFLAMETARRCLEQGLPTASDEFLRTYPLENPDTWKKSPIKPVFDRVLAESKKWPLWLYDGTPKGGNCRDLDSLSAIIRMKARYEGVKIFAVDPVHRIRTKSRNDGIFSQMDEVTQRLSDLVTEEGVVIVCVSHPSGEWAKHFSKSRGLVGGEALGGGVLTGEANTIFMVEADSENFINKTLRIKMTLKASRYGPSDAWMLEVDKESGYLRNWSNCAA